MAIGVKESAPITIHKTDMSDHRINLTLYSLEEIMLSGDLDKVIDPLIAHAQSLALSNANEA